MAVDKTKPDSKSVRDFHTNADTDGSPKALHHTLGPTSNQASPGNHTHDGGASAPIDATTLLVGTTLTGSKTTGDLTFRNSIVSALIKLGATDATS